MLPRPSVSSLLSGVQSYKRFVSSETTFLNSKCLGHLLCATGVDAKGNLFLIRLSVIDSENAESLT